MNLIHEYNPKTHKTPIKWLNSMAIRHVKLGENETKIKQCSTDNYPEESIVVKYHSHECFEINFMGTPSKNTWGYEFTPRRNVKIWRLQDSSGKLLGDFGVFDFKCLFKKTELEEYYPYINYILKQLNT